MGMNMMYLGCVRRRLSRLRGRFQTGYFVLKVSYGVRCILVYISDS